MTKTCVSFYFEQFITFEKHIQQNQQQMGTMINPGIQSVETKSRHQKYEVR